jgi:O-succinylhomoserine sulfhydrylase
MKTSGVDVTYVDGSFDRADAGNACVGKSRLEQWREGVSSTTRMAFMAPAAGLSADCQARHIRQVSEVLRETGFRGQDIQLVVDNTQEAATRLQPLIHGADFVLYTSTKVLEDDGKAVAGAICGRKSQMSSVETCMEAARVCVSPFNAWAILRGLGAENNQVLDHILGVGSMDDSDKVVSLRERRHEKFHECAMP